MRKEQWRLVSASLNNKKKVAKIFTFVIRSSRINFNETTMCVHSVLLITFQKCPSNCKYCIYNTHKHTEGSVEHRDYHNLSQLGVNYIVLCGIKMQCTCKYTYGDRLYLCNICIIYIQYIIIQYIQVIVRSNIPGLSLCETDCGFNVPRCSNSK